MDQIILDDKVVLVVGASSGMGREAAKYMATICGAKVVVAARRENVLQEVVDEIEAAGGTADYVTIDITDENLAANAVKAAAEKFGRLDAVVNSAGQGEVPGGLEEAFDTKTLEHMLSVDFMGIHNVEKAAYPVLAANGGGAIVNVSSIAAFTNFATRNYSAAKAACIAMDRTTASLVGPMGVRVNTICPGPVMSEMTAAQFETEAYKKAFLERLPMHRYGTVADIAPAIAFLVSDMSSWITGETLNIDGGWMSKVDITLG